MLLSQHYLLVACHNSVADISKSTTTDTDGMHLGHLVGNGTKLRHGAKGLCLEVEIQSCHNHPYTARSQLIADFNNMLVKELSSRRCR